MSIRKITSYYCSQPIRWGQSFPDFLAPQPQPMIELPLGSIKKMDERIDSESPPAFPFSPKLLARLRET
jgi:hypothetical protein